MENKIIYVRKKKFNVGEQELLINLKDNLKLC